MRDARSSGTRMKRQLSILLLAVSPCPRFIPVCLVPSAKCLVPNVLLLSAGLYLFQYLIRCRQCLIDILLIVGQADKGSLELGRSQIHTPL